MRIGLDIMGGDFAPEATTLGAVAASGELPAGSVLVLIGDKEQILSIFKRENVDPGQFEIIHADEVIGMGEHPTKAISKKPHSSINIGFKLLQEGKIDSFASAGNTGAMLVGAIYSVKTIPGIIRPSLTSILPQEKGGFSILLDVGANADCKPDNLLQFGMLGSLYAEYVYEIANPRVALLNLGEEEEKGNMLTQAVHGMMKNANFNFTGNIEGRDLFNDRADVVVCDGFTGNVVLKLAESFYTLTRKRKLKDEFFDRFNYENYGGSAILGVNAPVIIGHGISNPKAIKNMLLLSADLIRSNLTEKIRSAFN
jgi:phosphate acyltransferase